MGNPNSAAATTGKIQMPISHRLARWGLCFIGTVLSVYALYVETSKEANPQYKAMCDIGESMSCSKVFTSKYGRGFGILGSILGDHHILNQPNCFLGVIFYILQVAIAKIHTLAATNFLLMTSILSNVGSVYLAYILYFVLEDFCLVCVSTYIVNALLLGVNVLKWKYLSRMLSKKRE
ncbi:vitamin K epoxide reductase complex subunit 1-like protein 1 [Acanthaster planci]|uniref:vitamin-K-epoxide reductase (warfarin-sensitive) n=1 Tax=Acanthaster planci TaxID=133434 RepID=A0A8B7ZR65_ACAPL|nr:vitamin K epoxide reductase complex subunit 1-like protein 1 [Acanthaster planci]